MTEKEIIDGALNEWRDINSRPRTWARFEAVAFPLETRCAIKSGVIHSDGTKELTDQTIIWSLRHDNGKYARYVLPHKV